MSKSSLLKVMGVGFSFGDNIVLSGVNIDVLRGEMVGLVGPNGSGKSTLMRIISGVLTADFGKVDVDGQDILSLRPKDRAAKVAIVQQNPAIPVDLKVLQVVLMGRNPHLGLFEWEGSKDIEVCERVMRLTDTLDFSDRKLSSLSGGEMQRVFIARSLAQEAPLLLLDEPTAHLDIKYQVGIFDNLCEIMRETGVTVLVATHDLTLASQFCSRLAVFCEGVVQVFGEPNKVLSSEIISRVFDVQVAIEMHPVHKTPVVLPIAQSTILEY